MLFEFDILLGNAVTLLGYAVFVCGIAASSSSSSARPASHGSGARRMRDAVA
jgi:hypothetical protein